MTILVLRLEASLAELRRYAADVCKPVERRSARASAELIADERDKVVAAIAVGEADAVRWALGSDPSMKKGLIDIGSVWQDASPDHWEQLMQTCYRAHALEVDRA